MKTIRKFGWLIPILLVLSACNFGNAISQVPMTPTTPNMVQTAAAATVNAIHTEQASGEGSVFVTNTLEPGQPTNTPAPDQATATPEPSATEEPAPPTSTPWPTYTPLPTYTPYPTSTFTPAAPCNQMRFIRDVTIPDETWMRPGQAFTKIWEIQNTGSCAWDSTYKVVYGDSGGKMGGPDSKALPVVPVNPGEKVQIAIGFTAPATDDMYTSVWKLQPDGGDKFGEMTVKIDVDGNPDTIIFSDLLCSAEWRSGSGVLPCPNEKNNPKGSMYIEENPTFETGYTDDEDAIIMIPEQKTDGQITGTFFYVKMPANPAHFRTVFGCTEGKNDCNVYIAVYYRVKGTDTAYLVGDWDEKFDHAVKTIDVDLTSKGLEGKEVEFSFVIKAKGSYVGDEIFFLKPRIIVP